VIHCRQGSSVCACVRVRACVRARVGVVRERPLRGGGAFRTVRKMVRCYMTLSIMHRIM
jgi:hypothetical protein